jgi:general secretion pathway protein B
MSYILDALRRADAERERDPGRGIHAHSVPLPAETGHRLPLWIAFGAVVLAAVVLVALLLRPAPRISLDLGMPPPNAPVPRPGLAEAPPAPAAELTAPAAAPALAPAEEVVPPAPPPLAAAQPRVPQPRVLQPQGPQPRAPEDVVQRAAPKAPVAAPVVAAPAVAAPAVAAPVVAAPVAPARVTPGAPAAPALAAADRVLAAGELPPDVQRELPKLQISGGVSSDNPAQRMLIVGGQVVTEGAEAAPGVVVEQIRPKSAVLKFRGYRYSVQY